MGNAELAPKEYHSRCARCSGDLPSDGDWKSGTFLFDLEKVVVDVERHVFALLIVCIVYDQE
jgi:hypothetical protein